MITSSNSKSDAYKNALNDCRFGGNMAATYISPRTYYYSMSSADDYMSLLLLCIDQSRLQCEEVVRFLKKDSTYKGRVKMIANKLWGSPTAACNSISSRMTMNMTPDEQMMFGIMASNIDEIIQPELEKLANAVFIEAGRCKVKCQAQLTKVLSAHLFVLVSTHIMSRCLANACGNHYELCIEPANYRARMMAFRIDENPLLSLANHTTTLINALAGTEKYMLPYTNAMESGIVSICNKMTSVSNIYRAAFDAGLDIGGHSMVDLTEMVKALEKQHAADEIAAKAPSKSLYDKMLDNAGNKGWKVSRTTA